MLVTIETVSTVVEVSIEEDTVDDDDDDDASIEDDADVDKEVSLIVLDTGAEP